MATVTGYTAAKMQEINDMNVIDGEVQGDNLILLPRARPPIDAGNVRGPKGDKGDQGNQGNVGPQGPQGIKGDTGDVGELSAHSEATIFGSTPGEFNVASFIIPTDFKIGDRLIMKQIGSVSNVGSYSGSYIIKLKIDGAVIYTAQMTIGAMPNESYRSPWDTEYIFYQEGAGSAWIRALIFADYGRASIDSGSMILVQNTALPTFFGIVNPAINLAGRTVVQSVQLTAAQFTSNLYARGFFVVHHHAPTP